MVALVMFKLASGVVPPTAVNEVVPVPPITIRGNAPLIVPKEVVRLPEEDVIVLEPIIVTGTEKDRVFAPVTVMLAPS